MPFSSTAFDRGPLPLFLAVLAVALAARFEVPMVPVPVGSADPFARPLRAVAAPAARRVAQARLAASASDATQRMGPQMPALRGVLSAPAHALRPLGAGAAGLPTFAGGASGSAHLLGPTAGYLGGFVAAAALAGLAARRGWTARFSGAVATGLVGHLLVLGLGTAVLARFLDGPASAATAGLWPFLPGALAKSLAFAAILRVLPPKP